MMRTEALDFPKSILIETCSLCQGECKFCPYKEIRRNEEKSMLESDKYYELIDEIATHSVKRISLFNNNEPLLDKRIFDFLSYLRKKLPDVEITLSSNGRVLTKEILEKLYNCGLTVLYVSIPCANREGYKEVMGVYPDDLFELLESINDENIIKMVAIAAPKTKYFDNDELHKILGKYSIHSWNLEYKDCWGIKEKFFDVAVKENIAGPCDRPMDQAVISANGDVIICCRDWQGQNIVGNVYENTLYEIWHGEKLCNIQKLMSRGEYSKIECCKDCAINKGVYKR